jgi:chemotaxis protein MotB
MTGDEPRPRVVYRRKQRGYGGYTRMGVWKLAYADFVTAMMAFFMVMWLLTQADLKLRSQIALYFRSPGVLPGGASINEEVNTARARGPRVVGNEFVVVQGEGEEQVLTGRAKEIEREVKRAAAEQPDLATIADQVRIDVTPEGLTIQVIDEAKTLLFDVSSAELKPSVVAVLERIAPVLAKLPNQIQVGGHTDGRPFPPGSPMTNWQLAFQRADNARRVLENAGLRSGQIDRVLSFADTQPFVHDDPMADANRRLSIIAVRRFAAPAAEDRGGPVTDELGPPGMAPDAPAPGVPKADGRG